MNTLVLILVLLGVLMLGFLVGWATCALLSFDDDRRYRPDGDKELDKRIAGYKEHDDGNKLL